MKKRHSHQTLANVILVLVFIAAITSLYFAFKSTGKATQMPTIEAQAYCCCQDTSIFRVSTLKLYSELTKEDCSVECGEHKALSLGIC